VRGSEHSISWVLHHVLELFVIRRHHLVLKLLLQSVELLSCWEHVLVV